ncbi:pancreatic lipase-related protein 2-like [Asbolus verrucosus]|uniref:Pancreatic lipase-related protein 2-like n=1 Tax=Asbolus verrucosus TaxID=1661398 RepID=A0A482W8E7_ASBVE|nr:pancreatic lipase-related protein 2-like [Asbolus verrucosus]
MMQKKYPGFGTEWIVMGQNDDGSPVIGYLIDEPRERFVVIPEPEDAMTFTLYTREHPEGTLIDSVEKLGKIFDKSKALKFVTHGWLSDGKADVCRTIKDGFLKKYDANVFIVDWGEISRNPVYPLLVERTKSVANFYSKFLTDLIDYGVDPKTIHLVGHSLGAHVSGFAARNVTRGKIGRVTGLDPALPGFTKWFEWDYIKDTDAEFVDIIHTSSGFLGIGKPVGHVDFFPNGGSVPQPGCSFIKVTVSGEVARLFHLLLQFFEACSHGRSWKYFAESLTSSIPFLAFHWDPFQDFMKNRSCEEKGVPMGDPTPPTARGQYYLKTDSAPPFTLDSQEYEIDNCI